LTKSERSGPNYKTEIIMEGRSIERDSPPKRVGSVARGPQTGPTEA